MKVNFYANFRQLAGGKTLSVELSEGESVSALIKAILVRVPTLRQALIGENGQLLPHVHIFINGRDTQYLPDGMNTPLSSQDKIDIFPPVAGG